MVGTRDSTNFTLLDGGAMLPGAALAAVHLRQAFPDPQGRAGWCIAGALFAWLAVTAAGPFVYLVRRCGPRRAGGRPWLGDRLWALWGLPWVVAGLIAAAVPRRALAEPVRLDAAYVGSLGLGLFLATTIAVPLIAARILWGEPGRAGDAGRSPWSQWVGLALSATWPIQVGVGLLVMG